MKLKLHHKGQMVVGLAGYAGVGKNAIADELWFGQTSFAAELKKDIEPLLDKLGLDISNPEDKKKARPLMVEWGRLARLVNPDHWIEHIVLPSDDIVLITDVRYLNEANAIREVGGLVVYINRPGVEAANKEELASINELLNDPGNLEFLKNDGTLKEAYERLLMKVSQHFTGKALNNSKFYAHHAVPNLDGFYANPSFTREIDYAEIKGDMVIAHLKDGSETFLHGWNLDNAAQWIEEGRWTKFDPDTCGTCDGIHKLGTGACTYLGDQTTVTEEDQIKLRDSIAEFDMAMIQQEADELHAKQTQKRFTAGELMARESDRPSFRNRLWQWWANN